MKREKQPIGSKREVVVSSAIKTLLGQSGEKPFCGIVVGGVFMSPAINEPPDVLAEQIRNVRFHKS